MTVVELADYAGSVVVGRISDVQSFKTDEHPGIRSRIVLEDVRMLKGEPANGSSTLELIVPGGTVGEYTLRVCGAPEFTVGDEWVLFLLPNYRTHPVVGISQGAFRVEKDDAGVPRVFTVGRQPVIEVPKAGFIQVGEPAAAGIQQRSSDSSRLVSEAGVRVSMRASRPEPTEAISLEAFLHGLRPVLDASHKYDTANRVARPADVRFTPVPLRGAVGSHSQRDDSSGTLRSPRRPASGLEERAVKSRGAGGARR